MQALAIATNRCQVWRLVETGDAYTLNEIFEFAKAWDEACQQKADGEACGAWSRKGKYTVFESKGSLTVVFSAFEYRGGAKRANHLDAFSYTRLYLSED